MNYSKQSMRGAIAVLLSHASWWLWLQLDFTACNIERSNSRYWTCSYANKIRIQQLFIDRLHCKIQCVSSADGTLRVLLAFFSNNGGKIILKSQKHCMSGRPKRSAYFWFNILVIFLISILFVSITYCTNTCELYMVLIDHQSSKYANEK